MARRGLGNVHLLEPCAREELGLYLTACDLFLLPFKAGMEGISVPSRLYNVLAAGSPILGVCSDQSELAFVIFEEDIGWVVPPGDQDALSAAMDAALADRKALEAMGQRARIAAELRYSREAVIGQFAALLTQLAP
jgi:colanic acid biosynthesis glycosyl transferase WcaI